MKLYKILAKNIQWLKSIQKTLENDKNHTCKNFEDIAETRINQCIDKLSHGSGIDYDYKIDFKACNDTRLIIFQSYQPMDENGFYDKVIDFKIVLTANLRKDFDIKIIGNFGKYQDIKQYLYDVYYFDFDQDFNENEIDNNSKQNRNNYLNDIK